MNDPDTITPIDPAPEHWSAALVGDNEDRATAMAGYETPADFFTANDIATDWRRGVAGDDDKYYADLQRFNTPADYGNSFREAQQTIRSGNLKAALGEDATDEDVQAYREANGIPLEVEGYFKNLPEGVVVGEDDQELFNQFAGEMHGLNVPPEVMHKVVDWYNGFAENEQAARLEADGVDKEEANVALRESWGADYTANMNLVTGFLKSTFGEEAEQQLLNGRFQDGRAFLNDPRIMQGLAAVARVVNPIHQLVPGGGDPEQTLNDEIAEIEGFMRTNRHEYNQDQGKQDRLVQLYQLRIDHGNAA